MELVCGVADRPALAYRRAAHASRDRRSAGQAQGLRGSTSRRRSVSALTGVELSMQSTTGPRTYRGFKGGNERLVEKLAARKGPEGLAAIDVKRVAHDAAAGTASPTRGKYR